MSSYRVVRGAGPAPEVEAVISRFGDALGIVWQCSCCYTAQDGGSCIPSMSEWNDMNSSGLSEHACISW